jgi:hypothetical protein
MAERGGLAVEAILERRGRRGRGASRRGRWRGRRRGRRRDFQLALSVVQAGVDLFARFFQHAERALLALADAIDQLLAGALVTLVQALGDAGDLFTDIVDSQGVAALGAADTLGQLLGDAGDFRAQLLQGLSLDAVGAVQLVLDGGGDARHFSADLLDGGGVAALGGLDTAVEGVGDADHFTAHAFDGLGRALLGGLHVGGHLAKLALHAVKAAVGRFAQLGGHLDTRRFHALGQVGGQTVQPLLHASRGVGAFDGAEALVERRERRAHVAQRLAGAGLGGFKAFAQAGHDSVDQSGRVLRDRGLGRRLFVDTRFQSGDRLAGASLAVIEMAGDLAQGPLQGAKRLGRTRACRFGLDPARTLDGARLFGLQLVHGPFEAGGDGDLFTFRLSQARERVADGVIDARDGGGVAALGGFDALGQAIQGDGDAAYFIGRVLGDLDARRRVVLYDFQIGAVRRAFGVDALIRVRTIALDDHSVEPFAQRHAGATREVLGDLPCLGVDPLYAPWRRRSHCESISSHLRKTLVTDSWGVNATKTLDVALDRFTVEESGQSPKVL